MSEAPSSALVSGRYEIERLLGRGGMAEVYAVRDVASGRRLALKRLLGRSSETAARLFEREYHTLAGLRHRGIVEVFEFGRAGNDPYYTMELLEGRDLSDAAPLGYRDVCRYLRDAASILGVIHARGLVHRDLSPRNLWVTPLGRIKLLDFGALAPFGKVREIVGTPPFVPPEALRTGNVDARSDLYALGALGYWLLTGVHAYAAKELADLHRLWEQQPASIASIGRLVGSASLNEVPRALEDLLTALLQVSPDRRPLSTEELIDRLNVIGTLTSDDDPDAASGYLASNAFVGRTDEVAGFAHLLQEARNGAPRVMFVESEAGLGRSRLLKQLMIEARLAGAVPLCVAGHADGGPYATVVALCEQAVATLPDVVKQAPRELTEVLGHLSSTVRRSFGVANLPDLPEDIVGKRVALQSALLGWLSSVASERLIALMVDDLHLADEESQAVLVGLASSTASLSVAVVTSARRDAANEPTAAAQNLKRLSQPWQLRPMTDRETSALLRSVFGPAPHLSRLAARLHSLCKGNPARCLTIAQHLVDTGLAYYAQGGWVLPRELDEETLPKTTSRFALRLSRVTTSTRELAARLSLWHYGPMSADLAQRLSDLPPENVEAALGELERDGLLLRTEHGYRIVDDETRESLRALLPATEMNELHERIAASLLRLDGAATDPVTRTRAALHLAHAGHYLRAVKLSAEASTLSIASGSGRIRELAPALEECIDILRANRSDPHAIGVQLACLVLAGYFVDRRYALKFGTAALDELGKVLRLDLARRLSRWFGAGLALLAALVVARAGIFKRRSYALSLRQYAAAMLAASSQTAVAVICLDPEWARRVAEAIEPLAAMGKDRAAYIIHRICVSWMMRSQHRLGETDRLQRSILARLESARPIEGFVPEITRHYAAGMLFSLGISDTWRGDAGALGKAARLAEMGPLERLLSDHLLANHYAIQGDAEESARCRHQVELHAVQLGTAFQVEISGPADILKPAFLSHDAVTLKRASQDLERLSKQVPSLEPYARLARASYLLSRSRADQALPLLDREIEPQSIVVFSQMRGLLANALNQLGQHARARDVCMHAIAAQASDDIDYPLMTFWPHVELSLAESGLGNDSIAKSQIGALLQRYRSTQGPLVLASLWDAFARIAINAGEYESTEEAIRNMEELYAPIHSSGLAERVAFLRREAAMAQREHAPHEQASLSEIADGQQLVRRIELMLTHAGKQLEERAFRCLEIAQELSGADRGLIVLRGTNTAIASLGSSAPSESLLSWSFERLAAADVGDETELTDELHSADDLNLIVDGPFHHCAVPLLAQQGYKDLVIGLLVLGFHERTPKLPALQVLRVIARSLSETTSQSCSETTSGGGAGRQS